MSDRSDRARLEFVLKMIEDMETIVSRHGSVEKALSDMEGQNALFMCLLQIGEKLAKVENNNFINVLPVKAASSVRNFIAHDYDGIDLSVIKDIVSGDIPSLKKTIKEIIHD